MLDTIFTVAFENAGLRDAADPAVGQLESCDLPEEPVHLEIGRYEDGFAIFAGGRMNAWCERFDQLPLMLLSTVNRIAVFRSGAFCAIHAGAVRIRSGCALLVGPAGVGKSTLVAGLATSGYEALCDDTVLLADDALDVRPVRGGVWIKRGSWPVLSRRFPALGGTPERLRPDGIRVRQLPVTVDPSPPADGDRLPAQRIVFPCFDASAQPAIEPLEPAAALRNLTANLYLLDRRLDPPAIERLIGWISEVPCFRIRYPSLDSAIDQFRGIAR
jgi:hypothetical protein